MPGNNRISCFRSFENILNLEKTRQFNNSSVIGGLDKFIERWSHELSPVLLGMHPTNKFPKKPYAQLTISQRQEWVKQLLALLEITRSQIATHSADKRVTSDVTKKSGAAHCAPTTVQPTSSSNLNSSVTTLPGVNSRVSSRLSKLEVFTIKDLIYLFPRRYDDYSQTSKIGDIALGEQVTITAIIWEAHQVRLGRGGNLRATQAVVGDETGNIRVIWFGQPYLAKQLKTGTHLALSGKTAMFNRQRVLESPDYEIIGGAKSLIHTGRLVPVYPLTQGLSNRNLRRLMWQALERYSSEIVEFMPEAILRSSGLVPLHKAITQAHFPDNWNSWQDARKRLAFDELFLLQLTVLLRRKDWQRGSEGVPINSGRSSVENFLQGLPFQLTEAQDKCLEEIFHDISRGTPSMSRLLQGEVGSGKTVVAMAALLAVAQSGYQGSIMVPTELLAEQHFNTVRNLLKDLPKPVEEVNNISAYLEPHPQPISVGLVTGSTKKSIRRQITQQALDGSIDIIIGTHALIQEELKMPKLALAVVDEQHRFGVMQRAALQRKGGITPHMLIMSATPIPRTLALTFYGDLDISVIDILPPGRQEIVTRWVSPEKRDASYKFVRDQIESGRQAFIVCPLIEESEAIEAKAAVDEYHRLNEEVFPDLRLGLLHGRLKALAKEDIMSQFHKGELDILISTPVVEVGIDVPNATVMMVEAADRFGLAQLHQFRGRVGRGQYKSYCLLLAENPSDLAQERLSAIERIHNGFELAEADLALRGPGDFFGTRQSGLPSLRMARLSDQELLVQARDAATELLNRDPTLSKDIHQPLVGEITRFEPHEKGTMN